MIERVFAAIVLAACMAMLLRLSLGTRRRIRLDAALRRAWGRTRRRALELRHWRRARRDAERARRLAAEVISRARTRSMQEGNVHRPKSFRRPPRDKMH